MHKAVHNDDNDAGFSLMKMTLLPAERQAMQAVEERERERMGTQAMRLTAAPVLDLQTMKTDTFTLTNTNKDTHTHRGSCSRQLRRQSEPGSLLNL